MEINENGELVDERPPSPIWVLQQFSEEAFRVAGEALNSVYHGGTGLQEMGMGHRRARSEVLSAKHRRSNSFQRLKSHVQKAWGWGRDTRDEDYGFYRFDPEILANQKRQWYQFHSKSLDLVYQEPTSLFEHFIIAGLHPDTNLEAVEDAFAKRKKWELQRKNSEIDIRMAEHRGPSVPLLEPQILFKYPPGKRLPMRMKDLSAFCFPAGVKAQLLERTPSLSDLNEIVYGQVANNSTLYGVCLHVQEIVQRPPCLLGISTSLSHSPGLSSRFLVSAPRCYCLLTRVPFFELHFEMLNSIIAQERLNRVTQFISEISLTDSVPSAPRSNQNGNVDSPERKSSGDWMTSAIPIHSAVTLTAAAAGIISDDEILTSSVKMVEPQSPESCTTSHASELSQLERTNGSCESGHLWSEMSFSSRHRSFERIGSSESLFSPARSMVSEDEDDDLFPSCEKEFGDDLIMEWARENKYDVLQIVCGYHSLPVPERGCDLFFQPLEHLQSIEYRRPAISSLGFSESYLDLLNPVEVKAKLATAEETLALSIWTTATLCRALSLESVLQLIAGILLEKQVIVVCPNMGLLSATVLSVVPLICPFQWQSLLLPDTVVISGKHIPKISMGYAHPETFQVLPGRMYDLLDAPVPFIVGTLNRPTDVKMKTSNLVVVDILKDQVKTCSLPTLPRYRELASKLGPVHAKLANKSSIAKKHPVYWCNESQTECAARFLNVMRQYMESLCSNLRSHTITSVQSNNDRVSLLLKDSFIDSFSSKDRPFVKLLVDTQLFSVLTDSRLASFENGFCEVNVPTAPMAEPEVHKVQMKKP
ncbi:DENN domain-containing protein [Cucumis melo var. makuwa]|uniref:DENN domain-containing protein n=1 Tax=Cucumis melo var. makuwa TaxID=1194695 RepID=A0A5D3DLY5_CUCMM|nr:DENN domain-containing protein [Cucumis melo var. makuwa]